MMKRILIAAALCLASFPALAQSACPYIAYGAVLTAAQWNQCFQNKADSTTGGYLPLLGGTMQGRLVTAAPTTTSSGFNLPPGTAPTSPVNGDFWSTSAGFYGQVAGTTWGPLLDSAHLPAATPTTYGVIKYDNSTLTINGDGQLQAVGAAATSISVGAGGTNISGATTNGGLLWNSSNVIYNSGAISGLILGNGTSVPSAYGGTSCTNQVPTSLNASGAASCNSITNSYLSAGTFGNITGVGTLTAGQTGSGFTIALGTSTVTGTLGASHGGTGVTSLGTGVATAMGQNVDTASGFLVPSSLSSGTCANSIAINGSGVPITSSCPGAASSVQVGGTAVTSATATNYLLGTGTVSEGNGTLANYQVSTGLSISGSALTNSGVVNVYQQRFTSSGTYTPHAGLIKALIECNGGGGGGGGVLGSASEIFSGAGGGAGAYSIVLATAATIGASQAVTIGTGGGGGNSSPTGGSAGNTTSVGTICTAPGGGGGGASNASTYGTGGAGGTAGSGDLARVGYNGASGFYNGVNAGVVFDGGAGANSPFGPGGPAAHCTASSFQNGNAGGIGAGGSGGCANNTGAGAGGGNGGAGYVVITEYASQ